MAPTNQLADDALAYEMTDAVANTSSTLSIDLEREKVYGRRAVKRSEELALKALGKSGLQQIRPRGKHLTAPRTELHLLQCPGQWRRACSSVPESRF